MKPTAEQGRQAEGGRAETGGNARTCTSTSPFAVTTLSADRQHNKGMIKRSRALLQAALLIAQGVPLLPFASAVAAGCAAPGSSGAAGTLSGVINTYFASPASSAVAIGATSIPLGAVSGAGASVQPGDLLLIIQMQGATFNTSNTSAYGANNASGRGALSTSAGTYEYLKATSTGAAGGSVSTTATLNSYGSAVSTSATGKSAYQVVVVPQYSSATTSAALSVKAWDGRSGGVLALDVSGTLTLNATTDLSGAGFRGGGGRQLTGQGSGATNSDYVNSSALNTHGSKAEGSAGTPRYTFQSGAGAITDNGADNGAVTPGGYPGGDTARGGPGTAGGGGTDQNPAANDQNSGGGGGGNGGAGGIGGDAWVPTKNTQTPGLGGRGGAAAPYSAAALFLGGGGGAGTRNNGTVGSAQSSGGSGGGMGFLRAGKLAGSGTLKSNGGVGVTPTIDGGGGGGAGGSWLVYAVTSSATLSVLAQGASGTDADQAGTTTPHGPGGGGAGGVIYTNLSSAALNVSGGANGTTQTTPIPYGAASGTSGAALSTLTRAQIPGVTPADACTPASATLNISKQQQNVSLGGTLSSAAITLQPGHTVRYLLSVSNSTFVTATTATLRDLLAPALNTPASGTLSCPDGTTRTVTLGAQSISVNVISACGQNINPGQSVTLDFQTTVK